MARGINKVILVGNLGDDPEVRYTQGGRPTNDNTAIYAAADAYVGNPRHMATALVKVFHKTPGQIRRILSARNVQ